MIHQTLDVLNTDSGLRYDLIKEEWHDIGTRYKIVKMLTNTTEAAFMPTIFECREEEEAREAFDSIKGQN